MIKIVLFVV